MLFWRIANDLSAYDDQKDVPESENTPATT